MFIPTPVQELHLPLTQKLEVGPVLPVTAVPGVAEEAKSLDSRVALQWAQPVFAGAEGQAGRSALAAPPPRALLQSPKTAVTGYEPQGADPDALKSGDVHPLLAQGLSSWISGVLAKSSGNANAATLSLLMANASAISTSNQAKLNDGLSNIAPGSTAGTAKTATPANLSTSAEVISQLKTIYQSIAGSSVFAAQRLNEAWMPRKVVPGSASPLEELQGTQQVPSSKISKSKVFSGSDLEELQQLAQPVYQSITGSNVFATQRLNEAWMPRKVVPGSAYPLEEPQDKLQAPSSKISKSKVFGNSDLEELQQIAQPVKEPSAAQLAQWVSALEPDSDAAEQAACMLTQGTMVWLAELVPGLPMRINREDAWRNNQEQAGQLEKGAMLKVEITLPNLGQIRVVGSQWGQDISLHISHGSQDGNGKVNWTALAPELLQELRTQGLSDVKIESLLEAAAMTASNDLPKEAPNV